VVHHCRYLACVSAGALAFSLYSAPAVAQNQAVASNAATAQPAPATEAAPTANSGNDTQIVITAQKRAENVQKVPISVAAFTGQTLAKNNILTVEDLQKVVPNLSAAKGAQSTYLRLAIRGIGAASNTTVEPSVAVFLDGSYVPRVGSAISSMLDMDSVEVLRGPQGTLFGRNASVGAISFHTAQPKFNGVSGEVAGEVGTGGRVKLTGILNAPVSEHVAFRFAGSQQWFNGYWHNNLDGKRYGGTDETVLRGSFRADAGPLDWVVRADYARTKGDGATNIDFDRSSVLPTTFDAFAKKLGAPDTNLNDSKMNQFVTADLHDKQWGLNSTLSWDVGGGSTLRLIDNYRDWKNNQLDGDVIFTPTPILSRVGVFDSKSQNHELQFISPQHSWVDGRLDMVGGLYYFHEKYHQGERLNENAQFCNVLVAATPLPHPPFPVGATQRSVCNAMRGTGLNKAVQDVHQTVDSYAGYAQANFHFTDQIFATAGGRYSKDKKSGDYKQTADLFLGATARAPEALTFPDIDDSRFTYRLGLNYEPNKDMLFFGTYSTGYKSAGYNSGAGAPSLTMIPIPNTNPQQFAFHPERRLFGRETTTDWELGGKTSWLDHKLTLNLTLYRMNIQGFQDRAFDGTSFTVKNAGNLRHQGFEFDAVARPLHNLSLIANVAYLDSEFTSYDFAPGLPGCVPVNRIIPAKCAGLPNQGQTQNLKGKPATFAPKWTGRLGFDWTGEFANNWSWDLNSNLSFTSKFYGGLQNDANPQTIIDGYALVGARAAINGPGNQWTLAVFANNLLNKQYEAGNLYQFLAPNFGLVNDVFPGSAAVRRLHADPRTLGASFTFRY
jgi:iron complex outermembrane receptor protein